ncbi:MAG: hypothetical protein LBS43_11660 [Prevotellaceae bacterium]|jgi:hypothetical protein|nr:hypothetical protein [Prevotellaceae bacterium]
MMIKKEDIGIILKSAGLALIWVLIITYTTFPQLLEHPVCFLTERISFENTGRYLLFGIGIYVFDLLVQILYSVDKRLKRNLLVSGALGCAVLCVLIVPYTINVEVSRICPVLITGLSMGLVKGVVFYYNGKGLPQKKSLGIETVIT